MSSFRVWKWRLFTLSAGEPRASPLQPGTFSAASLTYSPLATRHSSLATPSLATSSLKTYYLLRMALIPIKTASETGYCDSICGCYELAGLRDEDTGKG